MYSPFWSGCWCNFNRSIIFFLLVVAFFLIVFLWAQRKRLRQLKQSQLEIKLEGDRVFNFLHGLGETFSEDIRPSKIHQLIVEGAIDILKATGGALYLVDSNGKMLVPSFSTNQLPPLIVIPEFVRRTAVNFFSLCSNDKQPSSGIINFLRLQCVLRGQGLIGEAWTWDGPKFLDADQLDPALIKQGLSSVLLGPLIYRNKTVGVLALGNGPCSSFSPGGIEVFRAIAEQSAFALYNQSIYKEVSEKQLLDHDLEIAQGVQKLLLPLKSPSIPGYQISGINIPARTLSGDYFDYITVDEDRTGIVIADVSGKGIAAALMMAMCRSSLRSHVSKNHSPAAVLRQVNSQLYPDIKEDMFISMAYVIVNQNNNEALLARAGHDVPLLYRARNKTVEFLKPKGMVVGIDSGEVFDRFCSDFSFHFEQGDCLLLYTDGVTEALNADGHSFGIERLIQYLKASASDSSSNLLKRLTNYIQTFVARQPQHDDITLIAIHKL